VTFLPFEDLLETRASEGLEREYCASCFGGVHPIREYSERFAPIVVPGEEFPRVEDESQRDMRRAKIFALASGNGTNVEVLAQAANDGVLDADFVGVGTNNPDAFVLSRAKRYDISEYIVEFQKDALKDPELRKEREDVIAEIIIESGADVLVLAGWMLILGDEFLQKMQEHGIVVLNLHPALLSGVGADQLQSSKGKVWEIRGVRAIEKAYDLPYHEMPASGVTVHQVLPAKVQGGVKFDVGPIVLREEVAKRYGSNESLEEWGNRIHEAEYRALPAAVNRVLHVINKGVDVSQGNYPW
jgi:folate-dependent phosphoribosylglycinamide formyltransferase PurN